MNRADHRKRIKSEVIATIVDVMSDGVAQGFDPVDFAMKAFVEVPETVIYEAFGEWQCRDIEQWWDKVERTIDVEVIRKVIRGAV